MPGRGTCRSGQSRKSVVGQAGRWRGLVIQVPCAGRPALTWSPLLSDLLWLPLAAHTTALTWPPRSTLEGETCRSSSSPPFLPCHVHSQTFYKVPLVARDSVKLWVSTRQGIKQTCCLSSWRLQLVSSFQLYSHHFPIHPPLACSPQWLPHHLWLHACSCMVLLYTAARCIFQKHICVS